MSRCDLLVLGAGPAGTGAALAGARAGLEVVLLEEAPAAGGQVYRAPPPGLRPLRGRRFDADHARGAALRQELADSEVTCAFCERVWFAAPGFALRSIGPQGPRAWEADALVVATGTSERVIPVPGSTLPGVIGLAAATILLKAQRMLPGEVSVVAGAGPLLAAVAHAILKGGGRVAAVVDLATPAEWLRALPALAGRPDLLARGLGWLAALNARGVPTLFRHAICEVRGDARVREVLVRKVDATGAWREDAPPRVLQADALAIGHGLVPATEVTRLLGADHVYRPERGGWIAVRDRHLRTSVEGLFVAGDAGGIHGAAAARLEGELAGLAAARTLGRLVDAAFGRAASELERRLGRARRAGAAMARLMVLRPGLARALSPHAVVCRCEDVTREEIDAAVAGGARHVNQLKATTRCGMGPCQGRMCADAAAELVAQATGLARAGAGSWTARVPLRPVPVADLVADYGYADIPRPAPAPA